MITLTNILYGCVSLAVIILSILFLSLAHSRNSKVLNYCLSNIKADDENMPKVLVVLPTSGMYNESK